MQLDSSSSSLNSIVSSLGVILLIRMMVPLEILQLLTLVLVVIERFLEVHQLLFQVEVFL